jgi:hypothetical protein
MKEEKLTSAFCLGEERQQITDAQPRASSKNTSLTSSSKAQVSDFPSIIKANASEFSLDVVSDSLPSLIWRRTFALNA